MSAAYRVYVLRNPEGRFYIGITGDISRRVEQHNSGKSRWTKAKGPWKLVWQSEEFSLGDARKLENLLKRQKRGSGLYRLTGLSKKDS
jgi:putative endonuclease